MNLLIRNREKISFRKEVTKMDFKTLASAIAKEEGKKHNASVGDVREILKITLSYLALMNTVDLGKLLGKYVKSRTKNFRVGKS